MSGAGVSVVTLRQRLPSDGDFQQCLVNGIEANDKPASGADDPRIHTWIKADGVSSTREVGVVFILPLSFRPNGGEATGTRGRRLPAQPTPACPPHSPSRWCREHRHSAGPPRWGAHSRWRCSPRRG